MNETAAGAMPADLSVGFGSSGNLPRLSPDPDRIASLQPGAVRSDGTIRTLLTRRELEVMRAVATLGSYQAAADVLGIAASTAQHYASLCFAKAGVHSQTEFWIAIGWLRP